MVFLPPKFLDQTNIAFARPNLAATAISCLTIVERIRIHKIKVLNSFSEQRYAETIRTPSLPQ
jgi:hypothetical protein